VYVGFVRILKIFSLYFPPFSSFMTYYAVFYVDSEGNCVSGDLFCVGSGAQLAYSIIDDAENELAVEVVSESGTATGAGTGEGSSGGRDLFKRVRRLKDAGTTLEEAVSVATWAVRHATYRDGFSGGYINVVYLNATGCHHIRRVDSKSMKVE
jgi:20S proteasome alpha/beta subunit